MVLNEERESDKPDSFKLSDIISKKQYYLIQNAPEQNLGADYDGPNLSKRSSRLYSFINTWFNGKLEDEYLVLFPNYFFNVNNCYFLAPMPYIQGLTYGDILICTAHIQGFTVRSYKNKYNVNAREPRVPSTVIQFVPIPKSLVDSSLPTTLKTLNYAAEIYPKRFKTFEDEQSPGKTLESVLQMLRENNHYRAIEMNCHPKLNSRLVRLDLEENLALAQILNAITLHLDAAWDWIGDKQLYIINNDIDAVS